MILSARGTIRKKPFRIRTHHYLCPLHPTLFGLTLLLLLGGSACRKQAVSSPPTPTISGADSTEETPSSSPSDVVEAAEPAPAHPVKEDLPEASQEQALPEPSSALVEAIESELEAGRGALASGDSGAAEERVQQAEHLLAQLNEKHGYSETERLEQAIDDLLGQIQDLEAESAGDLPEPLVEPEPEASPMDELGRIELFQIEVDPELEETAWNDLKETPFEIPVVLNKPVLQFLDFYQGRGRRIMETGLKRSGRYLDFFRQVFQEEGTPSDLIYLPHIESLFLPRAYSRARARGLWQFAAGTGQMYGLQVNWWLDERSNVKKSTRAAARHLNDLFDEFGDWYLALAAYNSGAGRVRRALRKNGGEGDYWELSRRRFLPRETRNYVPSFLASLIIFKHPEKYGFTVDREIPVEYDEVPVPFQVDLRVVADMLATPVRHIQDLNPQLRRGVTPFEEEGFRLKVPIGTADLLAEKLAVLPEEERLRVQHHRVRSGETLSGIAQKYGTSIRAIAEMNRIRNVHRLRLNQDLLIPSPGWRPSRSATTRAASSSHLTQQAARPSSYTVRRGDSLYRIARRYGLTVSQLAGWNNIKASQTIYPGQRLSLGPGN